MLEVEPAIQAIMERLAEYFENEHRILQTASHWMSPSYLHAVDSSAT
jgi:hypothetical protein